MNNRVCELRRKKGLSQQELADLCGVSRTTIWKIETGNVNSAIAKTLIAIAKALDAKVEEIFLL